MNELLKYMDWEIDEENILWIKIEHPKGVNLFKELLEENN